MCTEIIVIIFQRRLHMIFSSIVFLEIKVGVITLSCTDSLKTMKDEVLV